MLPGMSGAGRDLEQGRSTSLPRSDGAMKPVKATMPEDERFLLHTQEVNHKTNRQMPDKVRASAGRLRFSRPKVHQFCTATKSVCVPLTPPNLKINGMASLATTFGTTTLNWYKPTAFGPSP